MKIIENMLLLPRSRAFLPLITVWLEVRVLPGPPVFPVVLSQLASGPCSALTLGTDIGTASGFLTELGTQLLLDLKPDRQPCELRAQAVLPQTFYSFRHNFRDALRLVRPT
jgi:hypothetical protein